MQAVSSDTASFSEQIFTKKTKSALSRDRCFGILIRRKNIFALNGAIYKPEIILSKLPLLLRDDPRRRKSQKENLRHF